LSKFTNEEKTQIKSLVATLSLKRISDNEIIEFIFNQTNKTITRMTLHNIRQQIKKESYEWYKAMRQDQFAYIHEFKERINEIMDLQKQHNEIIIRNRDNPQIQQTSLAELHRLSITLSNLYDVTPTIINDSTLSATPEVKGINTEITV
jgi:nicotinic acid mononucleotide adenylyltransferase